MEIRYSSVILLLFCLNLHKSHAFQDLCTDARNRGQTFAADPADCSRYLYCTFNDDGTKNTTFQLRCDDDFPYFFKDACHQGGVPCLRCPEANMNVMFATDENCQEFALCRPSTPAAGTCGEGDNFDRSSGTCVPERYAPCLQDPSGPTDDLCVGEADGSAVPVPGSCTQHVICFNEEIAARLQCRADQLFNPELGICVPEEEFDCPYDARAAAVNDFLDIPRAKRKRFVGDVGF